MEAVARSTKVEHRLAVRARIALYAADGWSNAAIATEVAQHERTVRRWRRRMARDPRVLTLRDQPRTGRPRRAPVAARCYVGMLAYTDPARFGEARTTWSQQALADMLRRQTGWQLSRSEVCRTLHSLGIKPHQVRKWVHSPDADFQQRAQEICRLYVEPPADAVVVCVDEKPGIQALERRFATHWPGLSDRAREEFEYIRHGTQVLIAALDVRSGEVVGRVYKRRTANNLVSFMEAVAARYPSGPVTIIWDRLNIHFDGAQDRWSAFNARHGQRFRFVYTPRHASWLNQIEIWFSILARRVLKHGSFASAADLRGQIQRFIQQWDAKEAHPFRWKFRGDLGTDRPRLHPGATQRCRPRPTKPTHPTRFPSRDTFMSMALRI